MCGPNFLVIWLNAAVTGTQRKGGKLWQRKGKRRKKDSKKNMKMKKGRQVSRK
jgi:hypothetical protein